MFTNHRPWWAIFLIACALVIVTIGCASEGCNSCSGGEPAFADQKMEDYKTVEGGHQVWLNPGETYVPGSLRTEAPSRSPLNRYAHVPNQHQPGWRPTVFPWNQYGPVPRYQPRPVYYQPRPVYRPAYPQGDYDFGPYGNCRNCQSQGVKVDGTRFRPAHRNWTERRGSLKNKGPVPLDAKMQRFDRESIK